MYIKGSKYLDEDTGIKYDSYLPEYYFFDFESKKYILEEKMVCSLFNNKEYKSILELGVGTGRITSYLINKSEDYKGIDISQSMINQLKQKIDKPRADFSVFEINDFINQYDNFNDHDLICSFWAFNYSILSFFETENYDTNEIIPSNNLIESEKKASNHISKLFKSLKKGCDFVFFYFDAYSVEQSYATRIMEETLPFPYYDRGYTYKVFKNTLQNLKNKQLLDYSVEHLNGFVKLENDNHLLNYYKELHLKNEINSKEDENKLLSAFLPYKFTSGEYKIPAGVNIVIGKML